MAVEAASGAAASLRATREALRPWLVAVGVAVGTRVAFGLLAYAASYYLSGSTTGTPERDFVEIWVNWDAVRFVLTARYGYTDPATPAFSTAFFPLYPLTIRAVAATGLSEEVAGLLISFAASVVAFGFLYKLAEREAGEGAGGRAVVYLALFPTAVFLIAPYSESLYLAGAIPAFYLARTGRWALVGPPAAVAMGSRFAGVFVLAGLAVEFVRQRGFTRARLLGAGGSLAVALVPLFGYAFYLARVKGDPLYFFEDQKAGWGRSLADPLRALMNTFDRFDDPTQSTSFLFAYRMEIVAAAVGVAFVVWAIRKREWSYAAYMASAMLVLMTSSVYFSIPRILLTFFPVAIFFAAFTRDRPGWHEAAIAASATVAGFGVLVYTRGSWFF